MTTLPGATFSGRARKIAEGFDTSRRPDSVIAKNASSLTAPKRFLVARTMRWREPASLSK